MKINRTEYNRLHQAVKRSYPKTGKCEACDKQCRTHWSHKTHNYNPNYNWTDNCIEAQRDEWQELCPKCHRAYDMHILGMEYPRPKAIEYYARLRELKTYGVNWGTLKDVEARVKTYAWYKP